MRNTISALIVFLFAVSAFGQQFVGEKKVVKLYTQKRIQAASEWVKAARLVCEKTKDKEATTVFNEIIVKLVPVALEGKHFGVIVSEQPQKNWTYFLPLVEEDKSNGYVKSLIMDEHFFASYRPTDRLILVRGYEPCSELWKGLMLLHEAGHAGDAMFRPQEELGVDTYSDRETVVHNFQNRLMSKLGGFLYDQLVDRELRRIRAELKRHDFDGFKQPPGSYTQVAIPSMTRYYPELDNIFGPALSEFEKKTRQTHLWIHAVFRGLEQDRKTGPSAEKGKAEFLDRVYRQVGIISQLN